MRNCLLVCFISAVTALAAQQPKQPESMRAIFVQDQRDRGVALADNGVDLLPASEAKSLPAFSAEEITKRDSARRELVAAWLRQGKLISAEDFYDASFVFQHGQGPNDYLLAHVLAIEAIVRGDTRAKWIAAATLDRYLQQIGQKQIFGTQYSDTLLAFYLQHQHDPDVLDRVKAMQSEKTLTTQEPYNPQLLPETIRRDFCVPSVAAQHQYVEDANADKDVQLPRVADCKH